MNKIKYSDPELLISSRRNPLVKRLRSLASREGRESSRMLLLEGSHLLEEAMKTSFFPSEIIATQSWIDTNDIRLSLFPKNVPIRKVTQDVLEAALTTKTPDGVASIFPIDGLPKINKSPKFVLALARLQDPGNMGNLFRTALAADVEMLWLALGADPLSQKVLRASAGSVLHMPFLRFGSSEEDAIQAFSQKLEEASKAGYQVLATVLPSATEPNQTYPYWELDWEKPTVLVLGNEGGGLDPLIKSICKHLVTLPHSKAVESLNVASVAVPMLFERRRAKMTSDM